MSVFLSDEKDLSLRQVNKKGANFQLLVTSIFLKKVEKLYLT
jgi:hypothetical protein